MTIEKFEDWSTTRAVPLMFDDTLTVVEMLGAIKVKCNELIDMYNDADGRLSGFVVWVDATLETYANGAVADLLATGAFDELLTETLLGELRDSLLAIIDTLATSETVTDEVAALTTKIDTDISVAVAAGLADTVTKVNDLKAYVDAADTATAITAGDAIDAVSDTAAANLTAALIPVNAAIGGKVSATAFIGVGRLIRATDDADFLAKAGEPQIGDVWFKEGATSGTDTQVPDISGMLVAAPFYEYLSLSGAVASDNVAVVKGQYRINAGAWVDFAWTGGAMPTLNVMGLTNGITYTIEVHAVDAVGNSSAALSAAGTPVTVRWNMAPIVGAGDVLVNGWTENGGGTFYKDNSAAVPSLHMGTETWEPNTAAVVCGKAYAQVATQYWAKTFTGTRLRVYCGKGDNLGKVNIKVDGVTVAANVDLYQAGGNFGASGNREGFMVYSDDTLSNGVHTVSIYPTGTKNASSSALFGMPLGVAYFG